jgi:hydrogenase maturation factor
MPRETKAAKAARVADLLAAYDERNRQLRKLSKDVADLKAEISAIEPGTYGDWVLATGTAREIMDQQEAKALLTARGIPVPTKMTDPPVIVRSK